VGDDDSDSPDRYTGCTSGKSCQPAATGVYTEADIGDTHRCCSGQDLDFGIFPLALSLFDGTEADRHLSGMFGGDIPVNRHSLKRFLQCAGLPS
jgi:hypothetical protein